MIQQKSILMFSTLDIQPLGRMQSTPVIWHTLKGYLGRGWSIYFVAGFHPTSVDNKINTRIHTVGFDVKWIKKLMRYRKIGFFARAVWWFVFQVMAFFKASKILSKHKIDVIYSWDVYAVPIAKLISFLYKTPLVSRFLGTFLGAKMKRPLWIIRSWETVIAYKMPADLIVMTNDGTQGDQVLKRLDADMKRVKFWMNGVEWQSFKRMIEKKRAREILNIDLSKHVLLTISRLASWKRVDRSIQALPEVIKELPDTVLIIVGDGPERQRLERLAGELGIRDYVRFEGAVPHKEVPKYLAVADIFLSFYDWSNVGNPLLEAMMAGKCIVTLNNGDTGRFIKNGENGVLLEYEDLPRLPEVIKELIANEGLRKRLGANARKFAEENFWSWEERIDAEIQAVEALLS